MLDKEISLDLLRELSKDYEIKTGHPLQPAQEYPAGKTIFKCDERPRGIYFVKNGRVKIIKEGKHGEDIILRFVGPNEFIGYVSLIKRWDYTSTAIAVESSKILFIPKQIFLTLLRKNVDFANKFLNLVCTSFEHSDQKVSDLIGSDAKQRLAILLLGLEMAYDEDHQFENSYVRVPRKDLASAIGVTPETISRFLSDFKKDKIVSTTDGTIEILNRTALLRLSKVND